MRPETRTAFTAYLDRVAQLNNIASAAHMFVASPSVQQTLETKIQESDQFLRRINMLGVRDMAGEKIGLSSTGPIAKRTNVSAAPRSPSDITALDDKGYACAFTEFDTSISYAKLDAWAKFPDFQTRIRDVVVRQQALDRIMIGFNGTSVATPATNPGANPLRQDVNIGWLQQIRANAAAQVFDEGDAVPDQVSIGAAGDYKNLDALVNDLINSLMPAWYHNATDLVVMAGRSLVHSKEFGLINLTQAPSEQLAAEVVRAQKKIGGCMADALPFFPDGALLITSYDNLSIYWQEGGRRRHIREEPERNRIANYESSNDAYVVEDYDKCVLVENIVLGVDVVAPPAPAPGP